MRSLTDRRHPEPGMIRRLVDDPRGVADADRAHIAGCERCRAQFDVAVADSRLVGVALAPVPVDGLDVDDAWSRLTAAARDAAPAASAAPSARPRKRRRTPLIAGAGAVAVLAGASVAAASNWLPIFRTEEVAPLEVAQSDLVRLPELSDYGDLKIVREVELRNVPSADAAAARTGLSAPTVSRLPRGVVDEPEYKVARRAEAEYTFSAEQAADAARDAGETPSTPPPGLDGSRYRLSAGPGIVGLWRSAQGIPGLAVARVVAPTAKSEGVPFAMAQRYLTQLPGMPADVARQLRAFGPSGTTLPLVVPVEQMTTRRTEVDGRPATVFARRDGTMSAVLWAQDGKLSIVAGTMSGDEVVAVARDVRWTQ